MRIVVFSVAVFFLASPASAGAWGLGVGESKAILQYGSGDQPVQFPLAPARDYRLQETFISLLVEHGATARTTLLGKASHKRVREALQTYETQTGQLGLQVDVPALATGLLPPYIFQGLKTLFPKRRWRREKRASVQGGLDWQTAQRTTRPSGSPQNGYHLGLSLADKITLGRVSVLQEVDYSETRLSREHHIAGQYQLSLRRGNWQIGSQAQQFENQTSGYLSLTQSTRLTWKPALYPFEISFGRGSTRVNNRLHPLARFRRGQQWTLEFQHNF
ncbi:MAG: hypothetical protein P8N62_05910 [Alphaproteobacteria bacterium]|nr:hypothetical protein [Alphaproteobacteria bacterium]